MLAQSAAARAPERSSALGKTREDRMMRAVAKLLNFTQLCRVAALAALAMPAFTGTLAVAAEEPIYDGSGTIAFIGYSESGSQRWRAIDYPNFEKRTQIYAPNMKVHFYDPEGNAATQLSMVRSAIVSKPSLIVLMTVSNAPLAILSEAKQAGIPVALYTFLPTEAPPDNTIVGIVRTAPLPVGQAMGKYVLDHEPEGAHVAIVDGDMAMDFAQVMHVGMLDVLKPAFDSGRLKLVGNAVAQGWLTVNAEKAVASILTANNNKVDAFIMGNDNMALGAITAVGNAGLTGKIMIIGQDAIVPALRAIMQDQMTGTVYRDFYDESDAIAKVAAYTLAKKPLPDGFYTSEVKIGTQTIPQRATSVEVIDKGNIERVIKDGMATKAQICDGLPASVGAPCN
jgi:D-xylose transport system substrate-binding protein